MPAVFLVSAHTSRHSKLPLSGANNARHSLEHFGIETGASNAVGL
ncbi:MAG: hypothetical protein NTX45_05315 [Proteobacteria bacterium]|nr:hypothetical protein [Pseudomonadota bacterium]